MLMIVIFTNVNEVSWGSGCVNRSPIGVNQCQKRNYTGQLSAHFLQEPARQTY